METARGEYADAIHSGLRLLHLNPNDQAALNGLADCYLAERQWARAGAYSRRALALNPNDGRAHTNLGVTYLNEGNQAAAQAEWQQVARNYSCEAGQSARDLLKNIRER